MHFIASTYITIPAQIGFPYTPIYVRSKQLCNALTFTVSDDEVAQNSYVKALTNLPLEATFTQVDTTGGNSKETIIKQGIAVILNLNVELQASAILYHCIFVMYILENRKTNHLSRRNTRKNFCSQIFS